MTSPQFRLGVLRGDEGSSAERDVEWLRVFRHFDPRLRDFFKRRDQPLSLDELIGEVWGRAFLFIATLKDTAALWSWLTTIGNNVIRDRIRSDTRRRTESLEDEDQASDAMKEFVKVWVEAENAADRRDDVNALIAQLPPIDREFLRLVAIDCLSHEEIAGQLGLRSAAASRQRLRRLRIRIQTGLQESGVPYRTRQLPAKEVKG